MKYDEIELLTENQVKEMAERCEVIKGHNCYFVNLKDCYDYSCIVFYDGNQLFYANDYELHHRDKTRAELDALYRKKMESTLFTDDELVSDIKNYDDYRQKSYYLHNHYGMRVPRVSGFQIFHNDDEKKAFKRKVKNMIYDPVGFCYVNDKEFVKEHIRICNILNENYNKKLNDYDYLKSMIMYEMGNHEYQINWQGNWDVITCCFGDTEYDECDDYHTYFNQLKLNDIQRKAFVDARKEYLSKCDY